MVVHTGILHIALLFPAMLPGLLLGQEAAREPATSDTSVTRNASSILLDRNQNTYNWIGRAVVDTSAAGVLIRLNELYRSNIIVIDQPSAGSGHNLQSSRQELSLDLGRPLAAGLTARTEWSSLIYADNKGTGLNNASTHTLLGGIEYDPLQFLTLTPLAGYRWDNQADIRDRGLSYGIAARLKDLAPEGYRLSGAAQFHQDHLDPRLLEDDYARVATERSFSGFARDSLNLGVGRTRREFYAIADSNIESRIENTFFADNLLEYDILRNLATSFYIGVSGLGLQKNLRYRGTLPLQTPQFDTQVSEFHLDAFLQAAYRSDDGRSEASTRFAHSERDETHAAIENPGAPGNVQILFADRNRQEHSKDNLSRRTMLSGSLSLPVSSSDRVSLSGVASILHYDTQSDLNVEDRDELLYSLSLDAWHRISPALDLGWSLDATMSHIVYLLSERSANNNINRVLRFSPRTTLRPTKDFTTTNVFEVLANYTVYDYEQQVALVRSFSYRQFGWLDSSSVELTDRIGLDILAYLKLYDRGQLKWSDFTERLENSFVDKTYALVARFTPSSVLRLAVGLQYFSQTRYAYASGARALDSYVRSVGPTCFIRWAMGPHSLLTFRGWYENRRQAFAAGQQPGGSQTLPSMTMNLLFTF